MFLQRGVKASMLGVILLVALSGCAQTSSEIPTLRSQPFPYPVVEEVLGPPGSPVASGFVVEEGSWLLGAVFPQSLELVSDPSRQRSPMSKRSWSAYFVVTGNHADVFESYAAQAAGLGFARRDFGESVCTGAGGARALQGRVSGLERCHGALESVKGACWTRNLAHFPCEALNVR